MKGKHRVTLNKFILALSSASSEAATAASLAVQARFGRNVTKDGEFKRVAINLPGSDQSTQVPLLVLEPDTVMYPKSIEFNTSVSLIGIDDKGNVVVDPSRSILRPLKGTRIKISARFTFGDFPEGEHLIRDRLNSDLSLQIS